jgi:protein disulfide-isomerase
MLVSAMALLLTLAGQAPPPSPTPPPRPAQGPPKLYNEAADARAQIDGALRAAAEDDIRVLINWGANDDEACAKFQQDLVGRGSTHTAYETIRTKLSNEYRYLRVDVGRLDKNVDLAATYGVRLSPGALPHLTVLDKQGKVLAQQPAEQLAASPGAPTAYDPDKIAAFLRQHQVAPVAADPLLTSALAEAKRDGKYVFLWFSAPW